MCSLPHVHWSVQGIQYIVSDQEVSCSISSNSDWNMDKVVDYLWAKWSEKFYAWIWTVYKIRWRFICQQNVIFLPVITVLITRTFFFLLFIYLRERERVVRFSVRQVLPSLLGSIVWLSFISISFYINNLETLKISNTASHLEEMGGNWWLSVFINGRYQNLSIFQHEHLFIPIRHCI